MVHTQSFIVPITLRRYWHERITREEALRRLSTRNLCPERRVRIEKRIPANTDHYVTFEAGRFREYADLGDGVALALLMLPCKSVGKTHMVVTSFFYSDRYADGRLKPSCGITMHEFKAVRGQLVQNGLARPSFHHSDSPIRLRVDASVLGPRMLRGHPGGSTCCELCEWIHSVFDFHEFDWACCSDDDGSTCQWGFPEAP